MINEWRYTEMKQILRRRVPAMILALVLTLGLTVPSYAADTGEETVTILQTL